MSSAGPSLNLPSISIYQNPDHVSGLLQQLFSAPVAVDVSTETSNDSAKKSAAKAASNAGVDVGFAIPGMVNAKARTGADGNIETEDEWSENNKTTRNFKYSQAYYLLKVREELRRNNLVKNVDTFNDADGLISGDFVEFQASFRPNELHALLDIIDPEFVSSIVEHQVKSESLKLYDALANYDAVRTFSEKTNVKAQTKADLARSIARSARADFRAEKTREFYGSVADVTAITICDNEHFTVEDEDRILDGEFTVFGKVISSLQKDLPVLHRNKLLQRVSPEVVDSLFRALKSGVGTQTGSLESDSTLDIDINGIIDVALPSRISGSAFKVIPIAIYA